MRLVAGACALSLLVAGCATRADSQRFLHLASRLFCLDHATRIDQIDTAFAVLANSSGSSWQER